MENETDSCQLDIALAYEVFSEPKAMMLYPINALRNLARLQVFAGGNHGGVFVCVGETLWL